MPTTTIPKTLPIENKRKELLMLLLREGLSRYLAIGILANIEVETGETFDFTTKQKGRSNPAYGLFQFDPIGGLYSLYYEYLDEEGVKDSAKAQIEFIVDILSMRFKRGVAHVGRGNVSKVMDASRIGPEATAEAFCTFILRPGKPHMERRVAAATRLHKLYNG